MSITSPFICIRLVLSLSSLHTQTLCPGSLKLPSISIIPPARINCVIIYFHNWQSLRGDLSFGNIKVDHFSPTPLCFKYFLSRDFPEAPGTSENNNTCWCTRTLLSRRILSVEYPTGLNSTIIHLSPSLGRSRGILYTLTVIPDISTFSHILLNHPAVIQ